MSKFSKGDVVNIRGTIMYDQGEDDDGVHVQVEKYYSSVFAKFDKVTLVHRHFNVGDRVWLSEDEVYGYVRAVNGDVAWIQGDVVESYYLTREIKYLEAAPAYQEAAE
jgi:hypothetical protein